MSDKRVKACRQRNLVKLTNSLHDNMAAIFDAKRTKENKGELRLNFL